MKAYIKRLYLWAVRLLCSAVSAMLRLLGQGGTSLPGRLALLLCPDILGRLCAGVETILVTGTNGKTTTCALLRHMARAQGIPFVANPSGANLFYAIASAFVCQPLGRAAPKLAIIECDEANLPRAAATLRPGVIVVTNLFRDQLDRYGEVTHTRAALEKGIQNAPDCVLCLNADCSLTATLALEASNPALFYGLNMARAPQSAVSDAPRCLSCGSAYEYASHTFAHLGQWYCPACGRKRPTPDVVVRGASSDDLITAEVSHHAVSFRCALASDYNLYNIAAALSVAKALGWDTDEAAGCLSDACAPFGRGEALGVGKARAQLCLAKNPAGLDALLKQISRTETPYSTVFCLNDNDADGRDVSWIWDCGFESFIESSGLTHTAVWGTRRQDMLLRLKYAACGEKGLDIQAFHSLKELKRHIERSDTPVYIIANYTAMLSVRRALAGRSIGRAKWS